MKIMAKRKPITTKELIAKLLELDPDGNRQIWVDVVGDGWYSETVYQNQIELDLNDDSIVITLPFGDEEEE